MFRSLFVLVCSSLISLSSFAQPSADNTKAIEFNDRIVDLTDSLYSMGQEWGRAFNDAGQSGKYEALAPARQRMESFIDRQIIRVPALQEVSGSADLQKAMVSFLQFEKDLVRVFKPFENFSASTPSEDMGTALQDLKDYAAREEGALAALQAAQDAYAAKNGFTIAEAEEDEE